VTVNPLVALPLSIFLAGCSGLFALALYVKTKKKKMIQAAPSLDLAVPNFPNLDTVGMESIRQKVVEDQIRLAKALEEEQSVRMLDVALSLDLAKLVESKTITQETADNISTLSHGVQKTVVAEFIKIQDRKRESTAEPRPERKFRQE
jgi:hypothetical protein